MEHSDNEMNNEVKYDLKELFPEQRFAAGASVETQVIGIAAAFCAYKQLKDCPAGALILEMIIQSAYIMAKMYYPMGCTDSKKRYEIHSALHAVTDLIMHDDESRGILTTTFIERLNAMDTDKLPTGLRCPMHDEAEEYPL